MYNKQPLHASPVMTTQTPLLMMLMHMHSAHKENKSGGTTTQETLCSQTMLTLQAVTSCQDDARYNPSTSIHGTPNKKDQATTCVCVNTRRHARQKRKEEMKKRVNMKVDNESRGGGGNCPQTLE